MTDALTPSFLRVPADGDGVAQPSLVKRVVARGVAVAGGVVGTVVVAAVALSDAAHRRNGPPPPRNT